MKKEKKNPTRKEWRKMSKRFCLFLSCHCVVCWSTTDNYISVTQMMKESLFTWRVELSKTEKYWDGWFRGLSSLFLTCPVPKLLLLAGEISVSLSELPVWSKWSLTWAHCAGVDRLDKDLTIGQMQGAQARFHVQIFLVRLGGDGCA